MVNYIDQRPAAEKSTQLFFVVFEWKDPFIQKVQDVSTAKSGPSSRITRWPEMVLVTGLESPKLGSQDGFCEMEILLSPMILKIDPGCVRGVRAGG